MGRKDKGDMDSSGGIGNNTSEVKRKSEDHRCSSLRSKRFRGVFSARNFGCAGNGVRTKER